MPAGAFSNARYGTWDSVLCSSCGGAGLGLVANIVHVGVPLLLGDATKCAKPYEVLRARQQIADYIHLWLHNHDTSLAVSTALDLNCTTF